MWGKFGEVEKSFLLEGLQYPGLAATVKRIHAENREVSHEVIVIDNHHTADTRRWLDWFALRWPWGDTTIDPDTGKIIKRTERTEPIWSGDVLIERAPRGKQIEMIRG